METKDKLNDTFNMKIDTELKQKFHKKCIDNQTSMAKVLKSFIQDYIEE